MYGYWSRSLYRFVFILLVVSGDIFIYLYSSGLLQITMKDISKVGWYLTKIKHNKMWTLCINSWDVSYYQSPFYWCGLTLIPVWSNYIHHKVWDYISYPLFADADMGIYPHAASQYHARPKAKHGIAMLSVDKFPYPRKQTRGNEFIPCSSNICDILKRFRSFESQLSH